MNIDKVCRQIGRTLNDDPELVKQIVMHQFQFVVDDTRDVLINKLFRFKLKNRFKDNKNKPLSPYEKDNKH